MRKLQLIVPLYNCEPYLIDFLDSINNQTHLNFSFLICDDCSTDNSLSILKSYKFRDDIEVKLLENNKNQGLIYTLNKLIDNSNSEILVRADPDDILGVDRLKYIYLTFLDEQIDVAFSLYDIIDENNKIFQKKKLYQPSSNHGLKFVSMFNSPLPHPTSSIKSTLLSNYKYDNAFKAAEDFALWSKLLRNGCRFHKISNVDYYYRVHNASESVTKSEIQKKSHIKICIENQKYFLDGLFFDELISNYFIKKLSLITGYKCLRDLAKIFNTYVSLHEISCIDRDEIKLYFTDIFLFFIKKNYFLAPILLLYVNKISINRLKFWVF